MKNLLIVFLLLNSTFCKADHWTKKSNFPGGPRNDAYGFSIGNKGYVGGGIDTLGNIKPDFWEYDPYTDAWIQKTNTPFQATSGGTFTIGNKAYYCFLDPIYSVNDLWEYDPINDSWIQKANFPGSLRFSLVAFVIGSIAYAGAGYNGGSYLSDFYSYDTSTNSWVGISNLPNISGPASAFTVNYKAYVTGTWDSSQFLASPHVFEYNPLSNSWSQKTNFPDTPRTDATALSISNTGYFGIGDPGSGGHFKDWWQYNPLSDSWIKKASIPCTFGKDENASFELNNKGYICFGSDVHLNSELWEYTPDSTSDVQEINNRIVSVQVFPNPFLTTTTITFSKELDNAEMILSDIYGKKIAAYKNISGAECLLHRNNLSSGIYFYCIKENGLIVAKNKIVVQ